MAAYVSGAEAKSGLRNRRYAALDIDLLLADKRLLQDCPIVFQFIGCRFLFRRVVSPDNRLLGSCEAVLDRSRLSRGRRGLRAHQGEARRDGAQIARIPIGPHAPEEQLLVCAQTARPERASLGVNPAVRVRDAISAS